MKEIKRIPEWQQKYIKDRFEDIKRHNSYLESMILRLEEYILGDEE